ncbi:Uncharacterized protein FWK35_00000990, partial [Aphis craccivora]
MMCVFFFVFVSVYSIINRNNASIFNFGGSFRWQRFLVHYKEKNKKKKKVTEKREFLRKTNFRPNRFFLYDSERCVFFVFVSVYSITCRNNASISNFGDSFRWKIEYSWCIIKVKSSL